MSIARSSTTFRAWPWWLALFALVLIVAGVARVLDKGTEGDSSVAERALKLSLLPPSGLDISLSAGFDAALAPDGRRLAFAASRNGVAQLYLRDLTSDEAAPLAGTNGGTQPFWSPDGGSLGFFADGKMRAFAFADQRVHDLADAPSPHGAAWHQNGDILFAPAADAPLHRRAADGRTATLTTLETNELSHRFPQFSPAGDSIVFFAAASEPIREGIWIAPYPSATPRKRLVKSDAYGVIADSSLLYSSDGALVAQRVDFQEQRLSGRSLLLGTEVGRSAEHQLFATTGDNLLLFGAAPSRQRELRWVDRSGSAVSILGEPMDASNVRIDPSGRRVAVSRVEPPMKTLDIWIYEGDRPLPRRLSLAIDRDDAPIWSRDGRRLAWVSGTGTLMMRNADGASSEVTIRKMETTTSLSDWGDARSLVVTALRQRTGNDLLLVPIDPAAEPSVYAASPFNEIHGAVSPDGRWLAYASDESGRFEVYVDSFPMPGRRARVTVGGGIDPRWARSGDEIFFRRGSEVHRLRLQWDNRVPAALTSERVFDAGSDVRSYDVSTDGQRFLLNVPRGNSGPMPMTAIINLRSLLPQYDSRP